MQLQDFHYHLPEHLIAQLPTEIRSQSRLMIVNRSDETITHSDFVNLPNYLSTNDFLVFNNTRVIPARLMGQKETGGKVEVFIERINGSHTAEVMTRSSKRPKLGQSIIFNQSTSAEVIELNDSTLVLKFLTEAPVIEVIKTIGDIPLPPYINRDTTNDDKERYQTIYAKSEGSVAAPTAGLHFDEVMLSKIKDKDIESAEVTLHVGAGTFKPVRTENINEHKMHSEYYECNSKSYKMIADAIAGGQSILAVGTTSLRCLESMHFENKDNPRLSGETDIFITPGYQFNCVSKLLTNFHLPGSTLLMLVSALAGHELIMEAYQQAVAEEYRFFSYGDAMLIL